MLLNSLLMPPTSCIDDFMVNSEDDSNSSNFIPEPYKYKKVFSHPMLQEKDEDAILENILQ